MTQTNLINIFSSYHSDCGRLSTTQDEAHKAQKQPRLSHTVVGCITDQQIICLAIRDSAKFPGEAAQELAEEEEESVHRWTRSPCLWPLRGQIATVLGFEVSHTSPQLCCHSARTALDDLEIRKRAHVPLKLC